ncbi:MAG: LCP family protein, partial [Culicoidibacterales bacterium]
ATVNQLLDTNTQYYVKTNFEGVVALIETLGGVPITVQGTFCEQDSKDQPDAYCFNEGEQRLLNGEEALAYARHRKTDGDEMRQVRQQQLLTAAIKQTVTPKVLFTKIPALIEAANQMIETNVPVSKILLTAPWFLIQPQINSLRIEGEGMMVDGIWYLEPDEASVSAAKAEL